MRILFLHYIGKKKYGGGERWVVNAASGLKELGHFVVVAGRKDSVLLQESRKKGVGTKEIRILGDFDFINAFNLSRYLIKHQIELIICKSRGLTVGWMASKWGGNQAVIRRTGLPPKQKSKKLYYRTKWFTDGVITNTKTIQDIYFELGFKAHDFVKVLYNSLTINDASEPFDFNSVYPGKTIVLCLGRLAAQKGYIQLIDALTLLKKTHPDILFFVLGDGKDKEKLINYAAQKNVEDMIYFAGYIHDPTPHIKGADFFLHPSLSEGMPNAAMEAMAYGKAVIMTNVNGAEELSNNGQFAWLIPANQPEAIYEAVLKAMENRSEFYEMGIKAKDFVRNKFGREAMMISLESYLTDRLERKRQGNIKKF
jgi:glycosyltransferase involved in cell wall biosynthesis